MSVISELVKELRILENDPEIDCYGSDELNNVCSKAADVIELLSAKLKVTNEERPDPRLDNGWIYCNEWLPSTVEYMEFETTPCMKRLEIAYMTDTIEYLIGFYDGSKWMDKHHNIIKNVIAWKPFVKLPDKRDKYYLVN